VTDRAVVIVLLGLQILFSAALFIGGFFACVRGLKGAGDSLDVALNGVRYGWIRVGGYCSLGLLGACLTAAVPAFWLSVCASC
jgi:hypothetical protein